MTHINDVVTGITPGTRQYKYNSTYFKLDGTDSSSSSARFRNENVTSTDYNGSNVTNTGSSRGTSFSVATYSGNSNTTNSSTVGSHRGLGVYSAIGDDYGGYHTGDLSLTNFFGATINTSIAGGSNASQTLSATNVYGVQVGHYQYGNGTQTMSNYTAFDYNGGGNNATNTPYLLNTSDDKMKTRPGALEKFNEWSYNTTHSSSGAYTIDWANGNLQTVTLGANITGFTMSNFPTDSNQSVGVTLYLVQDGTGSRGVTFSAASGETFKFANGTNTSSVSSANDIQTVYIFSRYNGSSNTYYWTIGPTFS
jgi:hypothetical protein